MVWNLYLSENDLNVAHMISLLYLCSIIALVFYNLVAVRFVMMFRLFEVYTRCNSVSFQYCFMLYRIFELTSAISNM